MATMRLEIVTAERIVYSEDVDILVAPGIDGELGILPRHAPLLTVLKPGEIRVVKDGEDSLMAVSGGFLEVLGNKVTILADTAPTSDQSPPRLVETRASASGTLTQQAQEYYTLALEAQRDGDWARYGEEIERLGEVLQRLQQEQ